MGNGKYGVALERSYYRTLEIGERKCVTPLPSNSLIQSFPAVILLA